MKTANPDEPDVVRVERGRSEGGRREALSENLQGLELTEDEAFALLGLCLVSPQQLDPVSDVAIRKLVDYCLSFGRKEATPTPEVVKSTESVAHSGS
ncbi:MAG: hypothetical protein ACK4XJ_09270 [Fimbriimonadaceae bacterium]